jgi:exosortase D (VPLPA-CTERM-specific)
LLLLAIPIPAIIFNQIALPLQLLASRFGVFAISACQIPVLREGNVIVLATTSLEVAEACSGIRSLVSLLTLAVIGGYLAGSPMWIRWVLAAASVPIAIFANGIRVTGTAIAAHFLGAEAALGFFHTFSGWLVFLVAGVLLLLVYRVATWFGPGRRIHAGSGVLPVEPLLAQEADDPGPVRRGLLLSGCFVAASLALGTVTLTEAVPLRQRLSALPLGVSRWEGRDNAPLDPTIVNMLRVDDYLSRTYVAPDGSWVNLYVGYYRSQRQGQTMHSPLNCLPGAGWEPVGRGRLVVSAGRERPAEVNRLIIQKGLDRQLVLYWYQAHGRIVASEYWGKIYTVVDAIRLNRSDGSLVRVMIPISSQGPADEQAAEELGLEFVNALLPALSRHLEG